MICQETMNRVRLSLAAYAYEYGYPQFMTDAQFDELSKSIDLSVKTGNEKLDAFFENHFEPCTGMWIHNHPEKEKLAARLEERNAK